MKFVTLKWTDGKDGKAGGYPPALIEALRQRRIERGLTALELSTMIPGDKPGESVHPSMVSMWERGKANPTPRKFAAWAAALGVDVVMGLQEKERA